MSQSILSPWDFQTVGAVELADSTAASAACVRLLAAAPAAAASSTADRKRWLRGISAGIEKHSEEFVNLIIAEACKPRALAAAEVARAVSTFDLAAELASTNMGELLTLDGAQATAAYHGYARRIPRGPVLAICPFNFPLNLVAHKVAPALASGCPVLVKPAPQTPLTSLLLRRIATEAGVPDDILVVLPTTNDVAAELVKNDVFAVVSFTGSDKVGWKLRAEAGRKQVVLELGGNAACIVHEDAPDDVVSAIGKSAFGYAGQTCIKTQRVYVHASRYNEVAKQLEEFARNTEVLPPELDSTLCSAMIDERAAARVEAICKEAYAKGASGDAFRRERNRVSPLMVRVAEAHHALDLVQEELFAPIVTITPYATWDDALRLVNDSRFGLQAGIFTDSAARIDEAVRKLQVGGVIVGDTATVRADAMPYGGVKDSGVGREGVRCAIDEYTETRTVVFKRHS